MKLAIVGSRSITNISEVLRAFDRSSWWPTEIISGGARGVDRSAFIIARALRIKYTEFPANWKKFGKAAGMLRNQDIVDNSDCVLVIWDGVSKGCMDTFKKAQAVGKQVYVTTP